MRQLDSHYIEILVRFTLVVLTLAALLALVFW